ncbi:MAG: ATP-binding cassette domain-containing protein [Bifidobacteriaceae bacterium]|jgi:energy-coupling factor transport system ATP-binding protein|nr:ATP-binding cassette domain-containing protein [Bifidobacteriaceae bacterium]
MIHLDKVTFTYRDAPGPTLEGVTLHVGPGELALVTGSTGAGKSTLLRTINGLVPHFSGGLLQGQVTVAGLDTRTNPPRQLAGLVGYVGQDPTAGFVSDTVEEELAYGLEQCGLDPAVMRTRIEEVLDLLGLAELRDRDLLTLSAGQAQRVAMGAALALHPRVLVLDEPTSALDPAAAEEVMAAIARLVQDFDMAVLMAEHRLERVVQFADQVVLLDRQGHAVSGPPREVLANSPVVPPVVTLGRALHWPEVPLTVREARRLAQPAIDAALAQPAAPPASAAPSGTAVPPAPCLLQARGVTVTYPGVTAVDEVDLDLAAGVVVGLMGRNGSGKSSLLWALHGAGPMHAGTVEGPLPDGAPRPRPRPRSRSAKPAAATPRPPVVLVPSQPTDLLWEDTVERELAGTGAGAVLDLIAPGIPRAAHPRDLSEGQRLALVLAIQLAPQPAGTQPAARPPARVIALDEPTRGLDYTAKARLVGVLRGLAQDGHAIIVASHDVEFLAAAADAVVWMAAGRIILRGPTFEVLTSVPAHAPQVTKVCAPLRVATVAQAVAALQGAASGGEAT